MKLQVHLRPSPFEGPETPADEASSERTSKAFSLCHRPGHQDNVSHTARDGVLRAVSSANVAIWTMAAQVEARVQQIFGMRPESTFDILQDSTAQTYSTLSFQSRDGKKRAMFDPVEPAARMAWGTRNRQRLRNKFLLAKRLEEQKKWEEAEQIYCNILKEASRSPEATRSLRQLVNISWKRLLKRGSVNSDGESKDQPYWKYLNALAKRSPQVADQTLRGHCGTLARDLTLRGHSLWEREVAKQLPETELGAKLRWEWAIAHKKKGNFREALLLVGSLLQEAPQSPITSAATYWAGRWVEEQGNHEAADALFRTTLRLAPNSFYAWRSAANLSLTVGTPICPPSEEQRPHPIRNLWQTLMTGHEKHEAPSKHKMDLERREKQLLGARTSPLAVSEKLPLVAASRDVRRLFEMGDYENAWRTWLGSQQKKKVTTIGDQLSEGLLRLGVGDYTESIRLLSTLDLNARTWTERRLLSAIRGHHGFWQSMYPLPAWNLVKRQSLENCLDPLLVMGLIRKESYFVSHAKSSAGAAGLMQLMPATAADIARNLRIQDYSLKEPEDNLQLGTWYLRWALYERFSQNSALALASYNAGPGSVTRWLRSSRKFHDHEGKQAADGDWDLFIEKIPYEETREYVKSVLGNYWSYLCTYCKEVSDEVRAAIKTPINSRALAGLLEGDDVRELPEADDEQFLEWEVQFGDTLSDIAHRFGIDIEEVRAHNPSIESEDVLYVGDKLQIPNALKSSLMPGLPNTLDIISPPQDRWYIVKPGDTLADVARNYDVEVADILRLNRDITNQNIIDVGAVLRLF